MTDPVLIVDDSLTVRMDLVELLEAAGIETQACATGAEARLALTTARFPLIILDVLLPDADGIELLTEIKQMPGAENTAVMLLSTEAEVRHRIRGLTTGADEYIGKPYEPTYLIARVRELMRRARPESPSGQESILVIDDSLTFREELRGALEDAGYVALVANTGEEGLRLAAHLRPTAIIVDGMLPGIDGATVIRRIRLDAALRGIPCLLLTASEELSAEIQAFDAGADAFIRKGDDLAIILARLKASLRAAHAQSGHQETLSLLAPKKILAVDDSETFLQELAVTLRGDGYEVVLARSGEEALDLLAVEPVECILLDLLMPGIGGQETCRRVKAVAVTRDIPVIMLTGVEDRDAMIQGLGAGADDYIAKSSDFEILRARLRAQIRRKQFEDENRSIREKLLRKELEATEARAAKEVAEVRAALVEELELKNAELEAFSYSVAHDLRAPLRSVDGFSAALLDYYADKLDSEGQKYLRYMRQSAQRMTLLIDDLLSLSRVTRGDFQRIELDLAPVAREIIGRLRQSTPGRDIDFIVADHLPAAGDARLLPIALENLLGNAWKFTRHRGKGRIEFFSSLVDGEQTFVIRDNGAGFDMAYAMKLFGVFQRLHSTDEFEGTGIGLATVQRIIRRHGGRIWADGKVDGGASFLFTLTGENHGAQIERT
jgi:two-component system NtrC family sensor kinase